MPIFAPFERPVVEGDGGGESVTVAFVAEEEVVGKTCEGASIADVNAVEDIGINVVVAESEFCAEVVVPDVEEELCTNDDIVVAVVAADEDEGLSPFLVTRNSELETYSPNLVPLTMINEKIFPWSNVIPLPSLTLNKKFSLV